MQDNFEIIKSILDFEEKNTFYFLQIFKRKKDNPGQKEDVITLKIYYIYSLSDLDRYRERIIDYCVKNNARAYIGINRLDLEHIADVCIHLISGFILQKQYKAVQTVYESACGSYSSEKTKKWIIDIDAEFLDRKQEIIDVITELQKEVVKSKYKIIAEIPTKSGVHIVTQPFNIAKFSEIKKKLAKHIDDPILKLEVKKDNEPTVLYVS